MTTELIAVRSLAYTDLPPLIIKAGEGAARRFVEYFTANIRNRNTRLAYARAVSEFLAWAERQGITDLKQLNPVIVAAYIEGQSQRLAAPTVKQHLAAIRTCFDWLVIGQVVPFNPAASVRGPKHVIKRGKTPVLEGEQARQLLDSIAAETIAGLRDRALIATMIYSFARVSAVVAMNVEDIYQDGRKWWLRLHEKGGKLHAVPIHHALLEYLDAYLNAAAIEADKKGPLFRSIDCHRCLTQSRLHRIDALRMVKRRVRAAGLPEGTCCHSFRATGITQYLLNGGTLEHAQQIANHESPKTTKLYDRTSDAVSLDEIERIVL